MSARRLAPVLCLALVAGKPVCRTDRDSDEGMVVEVHVVDVEGQRIEAAVVRHPEEQDRSIRAAVPPSWKASVLYLPDGTEEVFHPGYELELEVAAPGYQTRLIQHLVRRRPRKNELTVVLELQDFDAEPQGVEVQFPRP